MRYIFKGLISAVLGCMIMSGCKTVAIRYEANPNYKPNSEKAEEKEEWVVKEKMELRGVGKNEADFKAQKIKNDSGIKIPELRVEEIKTD